MDASLFLDPYRIWHVSTGFFLKSKKLDHLKIAPQSYVDLLEFLKNFTEDITLHPAYMFIRKHQKLQVFTDIH